MYSELQRSNLENVETPFVLQGEIEAPFSNMFPTGFNHRHDTESKATMLNMT